MSEFDDHDAQVAMHERYRAEFDALPSGPPTRRFSRRWWRFKLRHPFRPVPPSLTPQQVDVLFREHYVEHMRSAMNRPNPLFEMLRDS